jgi:hypothetical protein
VTTDLANNCFNSPVHRRHEKHMSPGITAPPDTNPLRINLVPRPGIGDRVLEIRALQSRDDFLSWLAPGGVTGAEATVVVDEDGKGGERGEELFGKIVEGHFFHGGEAMYHD